MSTFLAVVPAIWETTAEPCVASMTDLTGEYGNAFGIEPENILVIDNSRDGFVAKNPTFDPVQQYRNPDGHNLGVAESWNIGARQVLDWDLDWLVLCSTSILFGPYLHTSFREQVERAGAENGWPGAQIVEAMGHSWHLLAIHHDTLETVGLFDPWYWPAYEESIDWGYRQKLLGLEQLGWPRVWCNAMSIGTGIHVDRARWDAPQASGHALAAYYEAKWGGPKGEETFTRPFNMDVPLDWWADGFDVPTAARAYGIEGWW